MASKELNESGIVGKENGGSISSAEEVILVPDPQGQLEETERKARVNAAWEQMNKSMPVKMPNSFTSKPNTTTNKTAQKTSPNWMTALGLAPKKAAPHGQDMPEKRPNLIQNHTSDEAKKLAAAAISAVKDAAAAAAAAATGRGKIEVTEVRDFAGEDVEVKKFVDIDSKEATEKAKVAGGAPSAVDAVLEQIKKKQKLSVLDKTKKDWGEFKEENKGLEDELDAYKKSSNQYLDKVSFLQRTDLREFERERDVRLSLQSKRKSEVRDEP
ncbi:BCNT-C domain [Macleaya cordata]|uniref:BCNT-C domain n=1 Tax=Macleaya cordata TaxID=56857 RepID=A0A200R1U3_MACCD|nr:BCNT-C domain [Macleaya cordata]